MFKTLLRCALPVLFPLVASAAPEITAPTVASMAAQFARPPSEYGPALWWGWGGDMNQAVIQRDLDTIKRWGFTVACVEADNGITSKYLSPDWFKLVRIACTEARKRDMKLWFEDEAKYPSGFAGGRFTAERPDLGMQVLALAPNVTTPATGGATVQQDLPADTVGALATNTDGTVVSIDVSSGKLDWTAPAGNWTIQFVRHEYRTSPTRSVNNPSRGAKDTSETLEDYLNPEATAKFIEWTHEQYKAAVPDEFGQTLLGFTGDEPDFTIGNAIPWTNALFDRFKAEKGYDLRPYVGALLARGPIAAPARRADVAGTRAPVGKRNEQQERVYVDYCDVWSDMFRDNFFKMQGDWCAANHVQYQLHINHEDMLMSLVQSEGDFFKCMRYVEMPGIDLIYHQLFDDNITDFPKLASSVADVFGRARSYTESFAAMRPVTPNVVQAEWDLNDQLSRGVNMDEIMWWPGTGASRARREGGATTAPAGQRGPSFFQQPAWAPVAKSLQRACYVMSNGKPTAEIALYVPFTSMWFGDRDAYASLLAASATLLQHQRDFDFVDEQALSSVLQLDGGKLTNLSGTSYRAIVIPSVTVISRAALDRLKAFAAAGGKVIFLGRLPVIANGSTFLDAAAPGDFSWAITETARSLQPSPQPFVAESLELSDRVLAALPPPQVSLATPALAVKYNHRHWADGEAYFFFNESTTASVDNSVTLSTTDGQKATAQIWDANTGMISAITPTGRTDGSVTLPLKMAPQATQIIVLGPATAAAGSITH